ncbi:MAG TPA: DUF1501 domain-containing protein [Pyrinomonadaceae bacterium]
MPTSRRDFLRRTGCLLGGAAIASTLDGFKLLSAYAQDSAADDYRALVCVFLNGGNDGNNMVVPFDDARYNQYNAARGAAGLAIPKASLLAVNPASGNQYGLHPNMPELQTLFGQGKLAVVCNTGPLVEPLTRATYQSGAGKRPLQLFSHSDQVNLWQTSIANNASQTGWGGRTADRTAPLNGAATFPQVVSIAGISTFVIGANARPLAISDSNTALSSVLPLNNAPNATTAETNARRAAFDRLRALEGGVVLVKASSDTTSSALQTRDALISAPAREFPAFIQTDSLARQLEQVARLIALRDTFGVKRQIFFCSLGGFDTHANQRNAGVPNNQDSLLQQVSRALKAFYDATVELGVESSVTTFTLSDFGRTLQPAGAGAGVGSDHGWGNHQFVMGGAVRGNDFYGSFPTLALGGPDDTDTRGRWIPTTSVEQYAATLAAWYGLSASDLPAVFPLIGRFSTPTLGFML